MALESGPEISVTVLPERIAMSKGEETAASIASSAAEFPAEGVDFEESAWRGPKSTIFRRRWKRLMA